MYPTHLMEFLALSEYPYDPMESFEVLPGELTNPDSPAVVVVEQMRPRGTWVLVQTSAGLKRCLRPSLQSMFRDTLRRRLPDDTAVTRGQV